MNGNAVAIDFKDWKALFLGLNGRCSRAQFRRAFLAYGLLALAFFVFALLVILISLPVPGLGEFLGYLFGLAFVILLMVSVVAVSVDSGEPPGATSDHGCLTCRCSRRAASDLPASTPSRWRRSRLSGNALG